MFLFNYILGKGDSTPIEFSIPEAILKNTSQKTLHHLLEACTIQDRSSQLLLLAKIILKKGKHWPDVKWRQFALMHNPHIIRDTSLEGGDERTSIAVWKFFFHMWRKEEPLFFAIDSTLESIGKVCHILDDLEAFIHLIPHLRNEPLSERELTKAANSFLSTLKQKLSRNPCTYLPLGYRHGVANIGHSIPCKVVNKGSFIEITPLNLGEASGIHPILDHTSTQDRVSVRYFPIRISEELFWGEMGLAAFCHIIRYLADPPNPQFHPYEGHDLYNILLTWGQLQPTLETSHPCLQGTSQPSGTCAEIGIENVVKDVLIDEGLSEKDIKKISLNMHFSSLIAGYHTFKKDPTETAKAQLLNAAEGVGLTLLEMEKELHKNEFLAASAVIHEIVKCAESQEQISPPPPLIKKVQGQCSNKFPSIDLTQVPKPYAPPQKGEKKRASAKTAVSTPQPADIRIICEQVHSLNKALDSMEGVDAFTYLYEYTLTLPLPVWNQKDEWDNVPLEKISQLLIAFESFLYLGFKDCRSSNSIFFIEKILAVHTVYVIADKLARRLSHMKLRGFATPFFPHLHHCSPNDFIIIPDGEENYRYSKITEYFTKCRESAENGVIFTIEPLLSVESFVKDMLHHKFDRSGSCHILYLKQFLIRNFPKASNSNLTSLYMELWEDPDKNMLPIEFHSLYYFVFLSHILFLGSTTSFPKRLVFKKGEDNFGKKALVISCENQELFLSQTEKEEEKNTLHLHRFREMTIKAKFAKYFEKCAHYTTNDAVCKRLSSSKAEQLMVSEAIFRDMLRITRKKNLSVPLAIQWLSSHRLYVENPNVQWVIDLCFFSPGVMHERLRLEPSIIDDFRECIQNGLAYFRGNPAHLQAILFLLRTGILFETHAALIKGKTASQETLDLYKEHIDSLLKLEFKDHKRQEVMLHWLFVQTQREQKSQEELSDVLDQIFQFDNLVWDNLNYYWIVRKLESFIKKYINRIEKHLSQKEICNFICNDIIRRKAPEIVRELKKMEWHGTFPIFECNSISINFFKRTISHVEKGKLKCGQALSYWLDNHEALKKKHGTTFWEANDHTWISPDGKLRFTFDSNPHSGTWERHLDFDGKNRWGVIHQFINESSVEFLNQTSEFPLAYYVIQEKERGDPDILVFQKHKDIPYARIDFTYWGVVITRLDWFGSPLPQTRANLSIIKDKDHPLYKCALRFCSPKDVHCFINSNTNEVEELNFINFGLHFKKTDKGLESTEFKGFFFLPDQNVEELQGFDGAFFLKNENGKIKIIIPSCQLTVSAKDFASAVSLSKEKESFIHNKKKFFTYTVDLFDGRLKSSHISANLFLALILKMKRDYAKAASYCFQSKTPSGFDGLEFLLLKEFTKNKDHSPGALSFNLQLVSYVFETKNMMQEKRFSSLSQFIDPYHSIVVWGVQVYRRYLETMSSENLSAIPKNLRLSQAQERGVLIGIKDYYRGSLPQVFSVRYHLLHSRKQELKATISPKQVSLRPSSYSRILKPSKIELPNNFTPKDDSSWIPFPNRLSINAIFRYFPELFERAKKCLPLQSDPFDFSLLAIINNHSFGNILFYVRHFPEFFQHISFIDRTVNEAFTEILFCLKKLEESSEYKSFHENFIKAEVVFDYQKEITLNCSPPDESRLILPHFEADKKLDAIPFSSICELLFVKHEEKLPLPEKPPFLDSKLRKKTNALEEDQIASTESGYEHLKERTVKRYTLQEEHLETARNELCKIKDRLHTTLIEKRRALILQLNTPYKVREGRLEQEELENETLFRLSQDSRQTLPLLPETIMKEVILKNDYSFLVKNRPLMEQEEMVKITYAVNLYYHEQAIWMLCMETVALIDKLLDNSKDTSSAEELASILDYEFLYNPQDYPEISYFKVTGGKLPRPDQVKVYIWVCEGVAKKENRLFQLPAGGGKTSYLIPLMFLRAKREHLMPVIFSTQAIYSVDKENLSTTLAPLAEKIAPLEIGLHMKLEAADFKFIYEQLQLYFKAGKGLLIVPQVFYSLELMYLSAGIQEKNKEKVRWLSLIREFFKTECWMIMDESHRNLCPLTRAIFGIGDYFFLPKHEHALFLEMMKPLLGLIEIPCKKEKTLADVARLRTNLQGSPSEKEIVLIKRTLAVYLSSHPLLMIPKEDREEFITYWLDKKASQPDLLKKWAITDKQRADLAALVGYFIQELLEEIVSMRTEFDHAPSIYPEEEFDTPCHHKTPSAAQYEDPYRSLSLSIKGTFHRHLNETQVRRLIEKLLQQDWQEQNYAAVGDETRASELFSEWVSDSPLKHLHLRDVCLDRTKEREMLFSFLKKNPAVISYYLTKDILTKIGLSLKKLTRTPAHLMGGFPVCTVFSATPLSQLIYPTALADTLYDPVFEAHVITEYCKGKNQNYLDPESPEEVFSMMKEGNAYLRQARIFLDPGGFFCDMPNLEVAERLLEASDMDAMLYFKEGRSLKVNQHENICLLLKQKDKENKRFEFEGSDIIASFKQAQLDWHALKIGTYYDSSHTESTNIVQKAGSCAVIFGGDKLTSSHLIQTIMRLRSFLDATKMQWLCWVFPKTLGKKILLGKPGVIEGPTIFFWTVRNEAPENKRRIILAAFQNIAHEIEKIADSEIRIHLHDPEMQIKLFQQYHRGFVDQSTHNPYRDFGEHERDEKCETVLWAYAKEQYHRFNYALPFKNNNFIKDEIREIIKRTKSKIEFISTAFNQKTAKKVEQHCRLKQEAKQINYRPRPFDPISAEGIYGTLDVTSPEYPKKEQRGIPSREVFRSYGLTDNLYFENNQLLTAKNAGVSMNENFIKPIDFFLIIFYEGERFALAISNEILSNYIQSLVDCKEDEQIKHQALLLTAEGRLCQKGCGALAPSTTQVNQVLHSLWLKDLVIDVALLRGQICHPDRLLERLKGWSDFQIFWDRVIAALPNPETANYGGITRLFEKLKQEMSEGVEKEVVVRFPLFFYNG